MAINFSKYIGKKPNKGKPALNEIYVNNTSGGRASAYSGSILEQKRQFWRWFKGRPELNAPVSARVNDTITSVDFYDLDGKALGRNKRKDAERFWRDNFVNERLKSIWFDTIVTGSGFGWQGKLNATQMKEVVAQFSNKFSKKLNIDTREIHNRLMLRAIDEDLRKPRTFDYIASSTMEVMHDEYEILGYRQHTLNNYQDFSVDEILHFKFSCLDGKVEGYTPVESLSRELILLWFIKENMISYIRNGGSMNKMFVLPEEQANSANHQYLVNVLQNQGIMQNRHGNKVLTGKVEMIEAEAAIKDMEYQNLALYVTSNIAYALHIPVSRIPYMIGKSQSNGDAGGLAEAGYWSMIESDQVKIENIINSQLFEKLGVQIKFRKHYKIDDLRETQAISMKADAITKLQSIFNSYGKKLSSKKIVTLMDLHEDDLEDMSEEEKMSPLEKNGMLNQGLVSEGQLQNSDKQFKNDVKRNAAENDPKGSQNTSGI